MCGIVVVVGRSDGVDDLLSGLSNLEYRGYDSAGIAVKNGGGIEVHKREGEVDGLKRTVKQRRPEGNLGIGHTRWSTHGPPTDENAHPHTDCSGEIAAVHNGIIDNYDELRSELRGRGHVFDSETDSEVVPHLIESFLGKGLSPERAFRRAIGKLSGSYALAVLFSDRQTVYATRQDSPLVLGVGEGRYFLASDVPAFREFTDEVVYLQDGDIVAVSPDGYRLFDRSGDAITRETETVSWDVEDTGKGGYDHYMLKEIHEQPNALRQTVRGRINTVDSDIDLDGFDPGTFEGVDEVQFVACGTSYHAAMYGMQFLSDMGVRTRTFLAGEYASNPPPVDDGTLAIAVTQSGETADTLGAIRRANAKGARTVAVTNTIGSSATRECDDVLLIRAGPEIGVAATKTFSSQVVALSILGERLVRDVNGRRTSDAKERLGALARLPGHVQQVLDESAAEEVAKRYSGSDAYFFIGRGFGYPVALEGALKFKEISYEHAEGFSAGELKHGPLALITPETPVFAVFTGRGDERTLSNVKEVQSRGGPVVAVTGGDTEIERFSDDVLSIPDTHPHASGVLANVQLQLVAYHAAKLLGRSIDKPRNLAKSVTVT